MQNIINNYISLSLYENAKFLAERLYYEIPSSQHLHLLATCFLAQGKIQQVYHLLKEDLNRSNRYLFARCCILLRKYSEGEHALNDNRHIHPDNLSREQVASIPGEAAGLYLLGLICRKEQRKEFAIAYFKKSLEVIDLCYYLSAKAWSL